MSKSSEHEYPITTTILFDIKSNKYFRQLGRPLNAPSVLANAFIVTTSSPATSFSIGRLPCILTRTFDNGIPSPLLKSMPLYTKRLLNS